MKKINLSVSLESCKISAVEMKNVKGGGGNCTIYNEGHTIATGLSEEAAEASGLDYTCE